MYSKYQIHVFNVIHMYSEYTYFLVRLFLSRLPLSSLALFSKYQYFRVHLIAKIQVFQLSDLKSGMHLLISETICNYFKL